MSVATKTKTPPTKPAAKKIGTDVLVSVVLDRSGSMATVCDSTISGYNAYLDGLKGKSETAYCVSAVLFDSAGIDALCKNAPLAEAVRLNRQNYMPRASTPLYDAIGRTIRETEPAAAGRPVVMMIVTDGYENASREFTLEGIKTLIAQKEADGWTFVFMGANIDSYAVGQSFGLDAKNIANYAVGHEKTAFRAAGSGTRMYASNRVLTNSIGQLQHEGFFDHMAKDEAGHVNIGAPDPAYVPSTTTGIPSQWINNQPLTSTGGKTAGSHIPFVKGVKINVDKPGRREHRPLK